MGLFAKFLLPLSFSYPRGRVGRRPYDFTENPTPEFQASKLVDVGWLVGRLHSSNAESFLAVVTYEKSLRCED